jgi:UDP-glucose 4-epimerase
MDLTNKRVAVIGGSGFLGSHLVDHLSDTAVAEIIVYGSLRQAAANLMLKDKRIRLVAGSVTDAQATRQLLGGVDGVFLLSALWLRECIERPRAGLDVNVNGAYNVLEACRVNGVKRLVFASSSVVYGSQAGPLVTEANPLNNTTMYGATKIAAEQFLRAFYSMYKLPSISCRFTNIYGTRQTSKGDATSVVVRFLRRVTSHHPPIIFGDGQQGFDFINVRDAVRATVLAMQSDIEQDVFNIASGVNTTIIELAKMLLELTGSELEPVFQPAPGGTSWSPLFSTEHARRQLGFQAEIPLRAGLDEMVNWYIHLQREMSNGTTDQ